MTRPLPSALETAVDEPVVRPFSVLLIDLPDPVYVFSGLGQLVFDDADGVTAGMDRRGQDRRDRHGRRDDGRQRDRDPSDPVRCAEPSFATTSTTDQQAVRGVKFDYGIGVFNETFSSVDAVAWLHRYRLDQYKITDAGATLSVEVTGESRSIDQRRPAIKRFTDEYQQRMHPGDRFFEYVPQMSRCRSCGTKAEQSARRSAATLPAARPATGATSSTRFKAHPIGRSSGLGTPLRRAAAERVKTVTGSQTSGPSSAAARARGARRRRFTGGSGSRTSRTQ
jgi:hypothetical protein